MVSRFLFEATYSLTLVVVMFLEFAFSRVPFRLLHFFYTCLVALMYILGNYIGFLINPRRNTTYSGIIDWTDNDAGFVLGTIETLLAGVLNYKPCMVQ